jgi:hypothetical protein
MFAVRLLMMTSLILGLAGMGDAADLAQKTKKNKKKGSAITALIKAVNPDQDKPGTGTLTVQVFDGKAKKGQPPTGPEKRITVTADTRVEKLEGKAKKGQPLTGQPARFADLQANNRVIIQLKTGLETIADRVLIASPKKKKKDIQE